MSALPTVTASNCATNADSNVSATNNKNANPSPSTTKKQTTRKVFSHQAQLELENAFRASPYLTAWKRQCLSQKLSLTERQVRVWFQNRRMRIKSERRLQQRQTTANHRNTIDPACKAVEFSPPPDYMTAITTTQQCFVSNSNNCGVVTQPYTTTFLSNQFATSSTHLPIYTNTVSSMNEFYTQPPTTSTPFNYNSSVFFNVGKNNTFQSPSTSFHMQQQHQPRFELQQLPLLDQQQVPQLQQLPQQQQHPLQQDNETENFLNNFDIRELRALTTPSSFQTEDILPYGSVI